MATVTRASSTGKRNGEGVVLVLDIGTSSGRVGLVDRYGSVLAVIGRAHSLAPDQHGHTDVDVRAAWTQLITAIKQMVVFARERSLPVVALSTTSIRGAMTLLDKDGTPVWSWGSIDDRALELIVESKADENAFHALTGQRSVYAAMPRLRWLARERPDLWPQVRSLLTLDAWLLRCLTGRLVIPVTSAAPTGLLEASTSTWLEPGDEPWRPDANILGFLPTLVESGTQVGGLSTSVALETGLEAGLPVAAGGGDGQMATLGTGCLESGDSAIIMGSHWQAILTLDSPRHDPEARFRVIRGPIKDTWQTDAIALGAGLQLDRFVQSLGGGEDHDQLAARAAGLGPGAGGVLAVGGAPLDLQPWTNAAPTLIGAAWSDPHQERAAAWRAIVEAGCLVTRHNLDVVQAALHRDVDARPIRAGGGASRSDLVCRILASVLGRTVIRGRSHQSSLLGAAVCAGVAVGWYPDLASGARIAGAEVSRFEPDAADHVAYQGVDARWWAALQAQAELARSGVTRPIITSPA